MPPEMPSSAPGSPAEGGRSGSWIAWGEALAPLLAANLGLALVFDLDRHVVLALLLAGAAFLVLPWAERRLETAGGAIGTLFGRRVGSPGTAILLGALLLRLPLLPLPLS